MDTTQSKIEDSLYHYINVQGVYIGIYKLYEVRDLLTSNL